MSRTRQEKYVIVRAKTSLGEKKLSYHGEKWVFKKKVLALQFVRTPGPFIEIMSRDGKALIFISEKDDPDFDMRML